MDNKQIFLTFDMDWACDEVLAKFVKTMADLAVKYTINVTHNTRILDLLRADNRVELGIHPNFNFLLSGGGEQGQNGNNYTEVISRLKEIVPEAITTRSHSLTDSTPISLALHEQGIKYSLNILIPPVQGNVVHSYRDFTGLIKIPFCFEDDIWFGYEKRNDLHSYFSKYLSAPLVFNFHPIHIFLNTDSTETYERAKPYYCGGKDNMCQMNAIVNEEKYGARDWLIDVVKYGKANGYEFLKVCEGEWT